MWHLLSASHRVHPAALRETTTDSGRGQQSLLNFWEQHPLWDLDTRVGRTTFQMEFCKNNSTSFCLWRILQGENVIIVSFQGCLFSKAMSVFTLGRCQNVHSQHSGGSCWEFLSVGQGREPREPREVVEGTNSAKPEPSLHPGLLSCAPFFVQWQSKNCSLPSCSGMFALTGLSFHLL